MRTVAERVGNALGNDDVEGLGVTCDRVSLGIGDGKARY